MKPEAVDWEALIAEVLERGKAVPEVDWCKPGEDAAMEASGPACVSCVVCCLEIRPQGLAASGSTPLVPQSAGTWLLPAGCSDGSNHLWLPGMASHQRRGCRARCRPSLATRASSARRACPSMTRSATTPQWRTPCRACPPTCTLGTWRRRGRPSRRPSTSRCTRCGPQGWKGKGHILAQCSAWWAQRIVSAHLGLSVLCCCWLQRCSLWALCASGQAPSPQRAATRCSADFEQYCTAFPVFALPLRPLLRDSSRSWWCGASCRVSMARRRGC